LSNCHTHTHTHTHTQEPSYQIGDKVWVYIPRTFKGLSTKLLHPWSGPYRVIEKTSPVNYKIETCDGHRAAQIVHSNRMTICTDPDVSLDPNEQSLAIDNEVGADYNDNVSEPQTAGEDSEQTLKQSSKPCEILDKMWTRNESNRLEPKYFVRCSGLSPKYDSWVSSDNISSEVVQTFTDQCKQNREK